MERGPLLNILAGMTGTDEELDLVIVGKSEPLELRNVVSAEELHSAHGIKVTTKQNYIWVDASHVSAVWQARADI